PTNKPSWHDPGLIHVRTAPSQAAHADRSASMPALRSPPESEPQKEPRRKTMARRCGLLKAAAALLVSLPAVAAQAQTYPSKPVPTSAGSARGASRGGAAGIGGDAPGKIGGQQGVVVNPPGANGSIAARAAADAPNDGYTLFTPVSSSFLALPTVAPNLP